MLHNIINDWRDTIFIKYTNKRTHLNTRIVVVVVVFFLITLVLRSHSSREIVLTERIHAFSTNVITFCREEFKI